MQGDGHEAQRSWTIEAGHEAQRSWPQGDGHEAQRSRPRGGGLLDTTTRALHHRLAGAQAHGRAPSMAAGVVRGGRLVWAAGRGEIDGDEPGSDVQYRIGSITKTFVAVLVLRLRDEGVLDLGDRVEQHLPGTPVGDATIAQVLAHGSGLAAETLGPATGWWERTPGTLRPTLADVVDDGSRRHPPGRRHHYSNPGYALLGRLVEHHRGVPWTTALHREILEPLGMTRTTTMPVPPHAQGWAVHPWADVLLPEPAEDAALMGPAGQLWSTVDDLARFAAFLLGGDDRVLPRATLEEMRAPAVPVDGPGWDRAWGLGLQLQRTPQRVLSGHGGSMPGFVAILWCDPAQDVAAVAFANATSGPAVGALGADLVAEVAEREPRLPEPWRPAPATEAELALTGPWYWGPTPMVVRLRRDGELALDGLAGAARASRFRPVHGGEHTEGTWVGLDGYYAGEPLRAVRRDDGTVSHLDVAGFVFTRAPYDPADVVPGGVDPDGWRA